MLPRAFGEPVVEAGVVGAQAVEEGVFQVYSVGFTLEDVRQLDRRRLEGLPQPQDRVLDRENCVAEAAAPCPLLQADVTRHQEISGLALQAEEKAAV